MDALRAEQVLDAERNAFERTGLAGGDAGIRGLRHVARLVGRHRHIGVQRAIGSLDRADIGLRQFDGGDFLGS